MTAESLSHPCVATERTAPSIGKSLTGTVVWVLDLLVSWNERQRMRRRLEAMPDYMLRDMGISRVEVEREARKPFWTE